MKKRLIIVAVLGIIGFATYFTYEKCFAGKKEDTCQKDSVAVCIANPDTIKACTATVAATPTVAETTTAVTTCTSSTKK